MQQYNRLTLEDRKQIQKLIKDGWSIRDIAKELKRQPSTISREINKNITDHYSDYNAKDAEGKASRKRSNKGYNQESKLLEKPYLFISILMHIIEGRSPQYISEKFKFKDFPEVKRGGMDGLMSGWNDDPATPLEYLDISYQTIYRLKQKLIQRVDQKHWKHSQEMLRFLFSELHTYSLGRKKVK